MGHLHPQEKKELGRGSSDGVYEGAKFSLNGPVDCRGLAQVPEHLVTAGIGKAGSLGREQLM